MRASFQSLIRRNFLSVAIDVVDVKGRVTGNKKSARHLTSKLVDVFRWHARIVSGVQHDWSTIFISTFALPETSISCSVGVCQCQGIRNPADFLPKITDAPFDGSPL